MAHMPSNFETMQDAHRYAMLMFRRIVHSIREIGELAGDGRLSTSSEYQILAEGVSDVTLASNDEQPQASSTVDDSKFAAQAGDCLTELFRWRSAFSDLYERTQQSTDERQKAAAKSLRK